MNDVARQNISGNTGGYMKNGVKYFIGTDGLPYTIDRITNKPKRVTPN